MNDITVKPLKNYTPPNVPTLEESRKNPDFLKKLPLRWRKHAAIIVAAGLMGAWAFSGCAERAEQGAESQSENYNNGNQGENKNSENTPEIDYFIPTPYTIDDLVIRTHHGGSCGSPYYIAYLTEQEALGIIRMSLEAVGLNFNAEPPDYRAGWNGQIGLELFDSDKNVAIAFLNANRSYGGAGIVGGSWLAEILTEEFTEQNPTFKFGVFYIPYTGISYDIDYSLDDNDEWVEKYVFWERDDNGERKSRDATDEDIAQAKIEARERLEENARLQIQKFVDYLRAEGIL